MKYILAVAAVVAGCALAAPAWAGGACCAKGKEKVQAKAGWSCADATAGLGLTDEQKAKIAEIQTACEAAGKSPEACAKSMDEIRNLLSDEQKAQFDAACNKAGKGKGGGCG